MALDKTRKHDIAIVEKGMKSKDPNERRVAGQTAVKIKNQMQDGRIKMLRQEVLKQTRRGRNDNANDAREYIQKHEKGGYGRTTFTFSIPEHIYHKA